MVTPAGLNATPVYSSEFGCVWRGSGLGLEIGALPGSMAKEVEAHIAMANGTSTDQLAHLAWLRINGHYTIERVLEFASSKGCWLTLDVSTPATVHVLTYKIDPATGEPANSDIETALRDLCPLSRQLARNLRSHFDGEELAWWETPFIQPGDVTGSPPCVTSIRYAACLVRAPLGAPEGGPPCHSSRGAR